ncbi:hypothetical protein MSAN_02407700 [Mycena sanguinolenta]|uniref:Uncharacterized protein n=1 Tax=Mycena sanguinolenta TaxID=230812 RepID=A0A8H6X427_9AGAR|nr:hypothetical protein MSAN_02407700 [Mycena sanguinolenta]
MHAHVCNTRLVPRGHLCNSSDESNVALTDLLFDSHPLPCASRHDSEPHLCKDSDGVAALSAPTPCSHRRTHRRARKLAGIYSISVFDLATAHHDLDADTDDVNPRQTIQPLSRCSAVRPYLINLYGTPPVRASTPTSPACRVSPAELNHSNLLRAKSVYTVQGPGESALSSLCPIPVPVPASNPDDPATAYNGPSARTATVPPPPFSRYGHHRARPPRNGVRAETTPLAVQVNAERARSTSCHCPRDADCATSARRPSSLVRPLHDAAVVSCAMRMTDEAMQPLAVRPHTKCGRGAARVLGLANAARDVQPFSRCSPRRAHERRVGASRVGVPRADCSANASTRRIRVGCSTAHAQ